MYGAGTENEVKYKIFCRYSQVTKIGRCQQPRPHHLLNEILYEPLPENQVTPPHCPTPNSNKGT